MASLAEQSNTALDAHGGIQISVAPLSESIKHLLTLDVLNHEIPFWQHPKWWQLANDTLFNGSVELVFVCDEQGNTLAALPIERLGGLLRSPKHAHLTVSDSIWCSTHTAESINTIMDASLGHLNAWAWQCTNAPDYAEVRLCEDLPQWQWHEARESAWFDTSGDMPIPGKLRRNLSRHERNLESTHGAVQYSVITNSDKDNLNNALKNFLALEASGWKGESGTAINTDPTLKAFYQGMAELNDQYLQFEVHQMHMNDRCIASQLAFRCGSTCYLLKICYDEEYANFSPGSLLLKHTMQSCVESDIKKLSLVSAPDWAMRWKPILIPVWHVTRFANTKQGNLRQKLIKAKRGVIHHLRDSRS